MVEMGHEAENSGFEHSHSTVLRHLLKRWCLVETKGSLLYQN